MCNYYKYEKKRIHSSDCHIFEFKTSEFNIDMVGTVNGSYERLSSINTVSENNSIPVFKLLASLPVSDSNHQYPTVIIWDNGKMSINEVNPTESVYVSMPRCMIRCDATLIINGDERIIYPSYDNDEVNTEIVANLNSKKSRTIICQTIDKTIMIVVDGRRFFSRGFNINQCMNLVKDIGCINACIISDCGNPQLLYRNEIMTTDKYERRENSALIISSNDECKKDGGILCRGKIIARPFAVMYNTNRLPIHSLQNKTVLKVYDVTFDGFYLVYYYGRFGFVKGTDIKLI